MEKHQEERNVYEFSLRKALKTICCCSCDVYAHFNYQVFFLIFVSTDNLNHALGAIRVLGVELLGDELKPHLNTVFTNIREKTKGAAEQVVISGILPILALSLRSRGPLPVLTAKLVAELAKESVVRKGFADAGLVTALVSVLISSDQELLVHAARAIARMSYDNTKQQKLLLRHGVISRLVDVLLRFPHNANLEEVCLQAICNSSGMRMSEEAGMAWEQGVSLKPGECVFHGVAPRACGFASAGTLVRVSQWGPGHYAVNIEVFQRYSPSFWSLHANKPTARWFSLSSFGSSLNLYKLIKFSTNNVPRMRSLRTRMFHTLL
ncbi:rap1 GTPase-GDP dissociation stimulator 1 [Gouania willdenowi]|uniref:rap1 GTPase-GDP dissociation stimulator 1 n=1 Tax=Gouania willdenowi TaxID=441366 RepID=UPI001056B33A|nr:rap1 GTPase-GDP dissociation stimulator 1-like [Gouania willdenowi]